MEKRAEKYATLLCSGCHIKAKCKQHCISWYNRKTKYLFIAKEQEPISYLKGRSDAFAEMAEIMEQDKRRIIDKACKWIEKHFPGNGYVNAQKEFHYYNVDIFRRAMED